MMVRLEGKKVEIIEDVMKISDINPLRDSAAWGELAKRANRKAIQNFNNKTTDSINV